MSTRAHAVWNYVVRRTQQNSALQPVIEHLQRTLQFQPEDTADEKLHKLAQRLAQTLSLDLQEAKLPLFAALLSLPVHPLFAPCS